MASARDWYFKDWKQVDQLDKKGKLKHQYVYKGEYYLFPEPAKKFRIRCLSVMGIYTVLCLLLSFFPSSSSVRSPAGAIGLMQLVPVMLFIMTIQPMMKSPPKMTYRRYHRIFVRMRAGAGMAAVVLAVQIVSQIYYLYTIGINLPDLMYLLIVIADFVMMAVFAIYILNLKVLSDGPDPGYPIPPDE